MSISTAIPSTSVARVVGIKTQFKNLGSSGLVNLPQRVAVFAQPTLDLVVDPAKRQVTSALEAGQTYGFGSPIHICVSQLLPVSGDGVGTIPVTVYPLADGVSAEASTTTVTVTGTATAAGQYTIKASNIAATFTVAIGDDEAAVAASIATAVNASLDQPVTAASALGVATLTSKWRGLSANDIITVIEGPTADGLTFATGAATGGLVNPDIDSALTQVGEIWETLIVNAMDPEDTTTFDKFEAWGIGRWGAVTKKPAVVICGSNAATVGEAITIPDARTTDYINCQIPEPASNDLPMMIASRAVARVAVVANENPPTDYGSQSATGLTPGEDSKQWNYAQRDQAVKGGSSTVTVRDGVTTLSDTVTFYHPLGDTVPAYRYVVDIVKLQNITYSLNAIFETKEWDGVPLIPDNQPTTNPLAKTPTAAKIAVYGLIDRLALAAIISDPAAAKESVLSEIDGGNPKRLNLALTVQLSGNANVISIDLNFGFFFGSAS